MIEKIISGGQTGADQGGLDAAIDAGVPHGGWCPSGRRSETGPIPDRYQLTEMDSVDYPPRTRRNVAESDGTIVFTFGALERGSLLTMRLCEGHKKPSLWLDLTKDAEAAPARVKTWIESHRIKTLNVAGNRESKSPGIQKMVWAIMVLVLKAD